MRKRLLIGLLSAGLLAAMLPGVSSAGRDMVYVCHFPGHVNSDPATQGDFAGDFAWDDPATFDPEDCEALGARVLRLSRNAAVNGHGDNFPGP